MEVRRQQHSKWRKDPNCTWIQSEHERTFEPKFLFDGKSDWDTLHHGKDPNNEQTENNEWIMKAAEKELFPLLRRPSMSRLSTENQENDASLVITATHINHYRIHRIPDAWDNSRRSTNLYSEWESPTSPTAPDWQFSNVINKFTRTTANNMTSVIKSFIMKRFCRLVCDAMKPWRNVWLIEIEE